MKYIAITAFIIVIVLAIWGVMNYQNIPQNTVVNAALAEYFQNELFEKATADGLIPIEGFDADLLKGKIPTLFISDFADVQTFEGHYLLYSENGTLVFVRSSEGPISTAEKIISTEGYGTLLKNVSDRLNMPITDNASVDAIIATIAPKGNTPPPQSPAEGESVYDARLNQKITANDVSITPLEVLEDSRCAADVVCIQAGTVRVRAQLASGVGTAEQVFKLNEPITTEAEEITLVQVDPYPYSSKTITPGEYRFHFKIIKRAQ